MPTIVQVCPFTPVLALMNRPSGSLVDPKVSTLRQPKRLHRTTLRAPRFSIVPAPESSLVMVCPPLGIDSGRASVKQITSASYPAISSVAVLNLPFWLRGPSHCVFQFRIFIVWHSPRL